jgi:hypothetical protein
LHTGENEPVVIKEYHPKTGTWEGAEHLKNQLVAFVLVMNNSIAIAALFRKTEIAGCKGSEEQK